MSRKIISVLLVLTVLINVIGFGFMNVKSSAEVVTAITGTALLVLAGILNNAAANLGGQVVENAANGKFENAQIEKINRIAKSSGELVKIGKPNSTSENYEFMPAEGLSSSDYEVALEMSKRLNSRVDLNTIVNSFTLSYGGDGVCETNVASRVYASAKTEITNAVAEYFNEVALGDALGAELISQPYEFSWRNGGVPGLMASRTQYQESLLNDFVFSVPFTLCDPGSGYVKEHNVSFFGKSDYIWTGNDDKGYRISYKESPNVLCWSCGSYCIYNGKIYYHEIKGINLKKQENPVCNSEYFCRNSIICSVAADGEKLSDVLDCSNYDNLIGLKCGFYYGTNSDYKFPTKEQNMTAADLTTQVGGGSFDPGMTDDEATVMQAIAGLGFPADSNLDINSEGKISGIDGVSLSEIQKLLSDLTENQYDFSTIEEGLNKIAGLIERSNMNTATAEKLLMYIKNKFLTAEQLNTAIDSVTDLQVQQKEVLDKIEENTKALSDALAIPAEAEIEKEDFELDTIIGEHTGLAEASAFVDNWNLVTQIRSLLNNVLDGDRYSENPPNFSFYWDSNKDGEKEKYTALDLSFLETRLDNSNLEDKNRFTVPMTVRQFIQSLMLFVCYIAFAIKILKKLPGLFSGGESASEDFNTVEKIGRE